MTSELVALVRGLESRIKRDPFINDSTTRNEVDRVEFYKGLQRDLSDLILIFKYSKELASGKDEIAEIHASAAEFMESQLLKIVGDCEQMVGSLGQSMSKADYERFRVYFVNFKSIKDHITHFS